MYFDFANVLVFLAVGMGFIFIAVTVSRLIALRRPNKTKQTAYECGELPVGDSWAQFNIRFYVVAVMFLIFDVEVAAMYPVAKTLKSWIIRGAQEGAPYGSAVLWEIVLFAVILFVGLIYVWGRGDLEWIKTVGTDSGREDRKSS
ncbi:MAG: NADH-quinone oxidoreductase subunit A [Bdellovibrionota bacterium]